MMRTTQHHRIAEKNAAVPQSRRNSSRPLTRQPAMFQGVACIRIAAGNSASSQKATSMSYDLATLLALAQEPA